MPRTPTPSPHWPGTAFTTGAMPKLVPEDRARYSREHVGSEYIGWLHFQTIWNDLVRSEPDLFD